MITNTPSEPDVITSTPLPLKFILAVSVCTNELVWNMNKSVPPPSAFSAKDAVSANDELNTVIDAVWSAVIKFAGSNTDKDADNCANASESNPATLSALPALIAKDADNTVPITLSA
jgi:hypothetical protein